MDNIIESITTYNYDDKSPEQLANAFKTAKLTQEKLKPSSIEFKRLTTFQNECVKHIRRQRKESHDTGADIMHASSIEE